MTAARGLAGTLWRSPTLRTVPTRPRKGQSKQTPGFVQPLEADDPRLPQSDQTPVETRLAARDAGMRARLDAVKADLINIEERLREDRCDNAAIDGVRARVAVASVEVAELEILLGVRS